MNYNRTPAPATTPQPLGFDEIPACCGGSNMYSEGILEGDRRFPLDAYGQQTLSAMQSSKRYGAIAPWHWKRLMYAQHGASGELAIDILVLACEMWEPIEERRGGTTLLRKRFRYNLPQMSYHYIAKITGKSYKQIQRALKLLETCLQGKPLLKRFWQYVRIKSGDVVNQMFLAIYPDAIGEYLGWSNAEHDAHDTDEYDVAVGPDGEIIDQLPEWEEPIESIPPCDNEPDPEPVATVAPVPAPQPKAPAPAPTTRSVVKLEGNNRPLTDEEMDAIATAQDAARAGEPAQVFEYRLRNLVPAWRNSWGRSGIRREFLDYLGSEFSKHEWGAETTPKSWLDKREIDRWSEILTRWDAFIEFQSRRAATEATIAQTRPVAIEQPEETTLLTQIRALATRFAIRFADDTIKAAKVAQLQELWNRAQAEGLGDELASILSERPAIAAYVSL